MASADLPYPPAPTGVPADLAKPPAAYRLRVAAMIGGLFAFLLLYLALTFAAGWLAYWLAASPMPDARGRGVFYLAVAKFGGAAAAGLLCLFLVKGLFKGQKVERAGHLPLKEADHPDLFRFVRRVYEDAGAPPPRRVVVSPDVNAALVYDTSLVNLVVPPKKDLLIGLGLANVVDLVEFKAVLAHEFGHFAQRSVGLGSYLYVANQVMRDVIYSRDGFDRLVDQWARIDIRVSFPAWALKGVLWVVRGGLSQLYKGLNLLHLSLSRQMEFNADAVAVRLTGSDALIHGLSRLGFAADSLADAAQSLDAAADRGVWTDDLFYHQTRAAERLRTVRKDERLGRPPELPADPAEQVRVFEPTNDGIPEKYRSHPTDDMRERNAKRVYVRSPRDDRSPWLLFGDAAGLKQRVTELFYKHQLNRTEGYAPRPAAEVQAAIDAEHAETTYDPKYHGYYDDRLIDPGEVDPPPADVWSRTQVTDWLAGWPPADLEAVVKAHGDRQSESGLLYGLKSGQFSPKGKTFPFRGRDYRLADVDGLVKDVDAELEADAKEFARRDREVLLAHLSAARMLTAGGNPAGELLERYKFHAALQGLFKGLMTERGRLMGLLQYLSTNRNLDEAAFREVRDMLRAVHSTLTANLDDAGRFVAPPLTNVPPGTTLRELIADRGDTFLPALTGDTISGEWLGKLMTRLDGVLTRVKRLHFKSLGGLLACQERIAAEWAAAL